jgi:RNA polymerase sigma factor (sigma-70 family)
MHKQAKLTARDRDRIGRVWEDHRGYVEALAVQHAGREHAGDVVAEVGLRLCTHLNGLRDRQAIRTWIYRVTVSAARDLYQDQARQAHAREQLEAFAGTGQAVVVPDEHVRDGRRRDAFLEALERLKTRDKRLICNSLGLKGVPVVLGGADRVALSRARQRLRDLLTRPSTE